MSATDNPLDKAPTSRCSPMEWRRSSEPSPEWERQAAHQRGYMTTTVPGLLQTPGYVRSVLGQVIRVYGGPGDLDEGVTERLNRQRIMDEPEHTFHYVLLEQVLWHVIDNVASMVAQLHRLAEVAAGTVSSFRLGVVRRGTVWKDTPPNMGNQFTLADDREASLELPHVYLRVTDPGEVAFLRDAVR